MTERNTCPACGHRLNEYLHCPQACPKCGLPLSMWPRWREWCDMERRIEALERHAENRELHWQEYKPEAIQHDPVDERVETLGTPPETGETIPSGEYLRRVRESTPEPSKLVCPACAATQWPDGHPCGICGGTGEVECVRKPPAAVPEPRTPISLPDALTLADDIMRRAEDGREEAVVQETIKAEDAVKMLRKVQQEEAAERQQERTAGTWRGVYGQPLSQETAEKILAETAASNAKFAEDFTKQQERQSSEPRKPRTWWANIYLGAACWHETKHDADHNSLPGRTECVEFREILRDENGVEIESEDVRRLVRSKLLTYDLVPTELLREAEKEVERLKDDLAAERLERERSDDIITRLRVADAEMDAEVKRLRAERDELRLRLASHWGISHIAKTEQLTAERDVLKRQLAIAVRYIEMGTPDSVSARQCLELIAADAAREEKS